MQSSKLNVIVIFFFLERGIDVFFVDSHWSFLLCFNLDAQIWQGIWTVNWPKNCDRGDKYLGVGSCSAWQSLHVISRHLVEW